MKRFARDRTAQAILGASFIVSLTFNWLGVYASIDKAALPSLLLADAKDAQALKDAMLRLREKLYEERQATGESLVILANERHIPGLKPEAAVALSLGGRTVSLPAAWLHRLRALFLLHPYCETDSFQALWRLRASGVWRSPHFYQYGGFFLYPLGCALFLAGKLRAFAMTSDMGFYILHPSHVSRLYATGEVFIGFVASLGVVAMYQAGGLFAGRGAALLASVFFALTPLFAVDSHLLKPFSYFLPWMLWALYFVFRAQKREPDPKDYFLAGLFSGLSIGCLYLTWFLPVTILVGHCLNPFRRGVQARPLLAAFAGLLAGFLAFNPYYLLTPAEPMREWLYLTKERPIGSVLHRIPDFLLVHIPEGMGWPLWLLACAGAAWGLIQRRALDIIVLASAGLFTLQTVLTHGGAHYAAPLFPLLLLLASSFAAQSLSRPSWTPWARLGLGVSLAASFSGQLFFASRFLQPDPAYALGRWIHSNVPAGARIMLVADCFTPNIPFRYWDYRCEDAPKGAFLVKSMPADFLVSGECPEHRDVSSLTSGKLAYVRVASFQRSSVLDAFFSNHQLPVLERRYAVYKRMS